jgi:phospholipase C
MGTSDSWQPPDPPNVGTVVGGAAVVGGGWKGRYASVVGVVPGTAGAGDGADVDRGAAAVSGGALVAGSAGGTVVVTALSGVAGGRGRAGSSPRTDATATPAATRTTIAEPRAIATCWKARVLICGPRRTASHPIMTAEPGVQHPQAPMPIVAEVPTSQPGRIEHVVVLMLENRSFDHMVGFLDHPDPAFDGVRPGSHHNDNAAGDHIPASNDGVPRGVDPDHSHEGALRQLGAFGDVAQNGGFVRDYEQRLAMVAGNKHHDGWVGEASAGDVMRCLDSRVACPVLATLALEFALCQRWFSSVPGETWPNRNFAHAATSDSTVNIELGFYWDPTVFEMIGSVPRRSWRIYYDGTPQVWCFRRLWRTRTILDFLLNRPAKIGNWYEADSFLEHVEAEDLATYSFIEPAHNTLHSPLGEKRPTNSQHPGNNLADDADFYAGEQLIKEIYQGLLAHPALFAKTLLVIVYDEQGGLFDHAAPDKVVPPGDPVYRGWTRRIGRFVRALVDWRHHQERKKFYDFSGLGVRVPAVLVSPWIKEGTLLSTTFDHASIARTLHDLFAPHKKFLTKRDQAAAGFHGVVTDSPLTHPRPNPNDPEGPRQEGARPLPDLDQFLATSRRPGLGVGADTAASPEPPSPEAVVGSGELDRQLAMLANRVHRKLMRTPPALAARARAARRRAPRRTPDRAPAPAPEGISGPDEGRPLAEAHPVALFSETARTVRRRQTVRGSGASGSSP